MSYQKPKIPWIQWIGVMLGLVVAGFGIWFVTKEQNNGESRMGKEVVLVHTIDALGVTDTEENRYNLDSITLGSRTTPLRYELDQVAKELCERPEGSLHYLYRYEPAPGCVAEIIYENCCSFYFYDEKTVGVREIVIGGEHLADTINRACRIMTGKLLGSGQAVGCYTTTGWSAER